MSADGKKEDGVLRPSSVPYDRFYERVVDGDKPKGRCKVVVTRPGTHSYVCVIPRLKLGRVTLGVE